MEETPTGSDVAMVPPPLPVAAQPAAFACKLCGGAPRSPISAVEVCEPCRQKLVQRPFPLWIKISAGVIAALTMVAGAKLPGVIDAAVQANRARQYEELHDYARAESRYREVVERFPHSFSARIHLATAAYKANDIKESAEILDSLAGREIPKEVAAETRWLEGEFTKLMEARKRKDAAAQP